MQDVKVIVIGLSSLHNRGDYENEAGEDYDDDWDDHRHSR